MEIQTHKMTRKASFADNKVSVLSEEVASERPCVFTTNNQAVTNDVFTVNNQAVTNDVFTANNQAVTNAVK